MTTMTARVPVARFHFDPEHDASAVPSVDDLVEWTMARARNPDSPLNSGLASVRRSRHVRLGVLGRIAGLVPAVARRQDDELLMLVTASLRAEMEVAHRIMVEFGVDLREHRFLAPSFEALASYALIAPIEMEQRRFVSGNPHFTPADASRIESVLDEIDTEQRIAASHAGIRATLENDALSALLSSDELGRDRERHVAAMKAAIDEVRQVEMRQRLVDMVDRIEAARPK